MGEFTQSKPIPKAINSRDLLKREAMERKRSILYLIASYLSDINLDSVSAHLEKEAYLDNQYQVCDNVDLDIILQEYQSYYFTKFQRCPKILKKQNEPSTRKPSNHRATNNLKLSAKSSSSTNSSNTEETKFSFEVIPINSHHSAPKLNDCLINSYNVVNDSISLSDFDNYSPEWREMAQQVIKDFIPNDLGVEWKDCIGLEQPIEYLKEAAVYPIKYPNLFKNVSNWKGVLLYGPPGTGKTLLARALACESPGKFINVTSSTFVSKWRGESEKLLRVLFEIAKFYAPTTIFIDEVDAIAAAGEDHHHEASGRFKSELLTQIDGVLRSDERVFVLATTNFPWKLDPAMLRRFEKRVLVPLPDETMRRRIFERYVNEKGGGCGVENLEHLAVLTKNCSGSDIRTICKEAEMIVVREKLKEVMESGGRRDQTVRSIRMTDLKRAVDKIKPCVDMNLCQKYAEWNAKFGTS